MCSVLFTHLSIDANIFDFLILSFKSSYNKNHEVSFSKEKLLKSCANLFKIYNMHAANNRKK